jgi:hypothetical protein
MLLAMTSRRTTLASMARCRMSTVFAKSLPMFTPCLPLLFYLKTSAETGCRFTNVGYSM